MREYPGFDLSGKLALVTGASSGIGRGIAEAMARAGAALALAGRDRERLRSCAEEIRNAGGSAHEIAADLEGEGEPARVVREALAALGALDCLVHSAGVFQPEPFLETPLERLDRQWRVNVRAGFELAQAAVPHLRPGGSIVFLSSIAGRIGFPQAVAYCATKGAVELMTKALAVELAPAGIRVNAIAPGNIHTPMNDRFFESAEFERAVLERTPAGRIGIVEDVAPAAVYLVSDAARYVYGVSLLVDGGWVAQ